MEIKIPITREEARLLIDPNEEPHQAKRILGELPCNHIHYYDQGNRWYTKTRLICEGKDGVNVRVLICSACTRILVEIENEYEQHLYKVEPFYNITHEEEALKGDNNLGMIDQTP